MNTGKKRNRIAPHGQPKKIGATSREAGFASSKSYVTAVTKIYNQEVRDIDRFVRFAESHLSKTK